MHGHFVSSKKTKSIFEQDFSGVCTVMQTFGTEDLQAHVGPVLLAETVCFLLDHLAQVNVVLSVCSSPVCGVPVLDTLILSLGLIESHVEDSSRFRI